VSVDVLVVVADEALRAVIEIALTMDGCVVRTAADETSAMDRIAAAAPGVILVDGTLPFAEEIEGWTARHAPHIPLVLLVTAWEEQPRFSRNAVAILPMPFGRAELRRALAAVSSAHIDRG
jgi:CheY-like chemotaxis protein